MSAAFEFREYLCWGSNGMIEDYLGQMARAAAAISASDNNLARWLDHQHQSFYHGAVIRLDDILTEDMAAKQFIQLLDVVTQKLLEDNRFSEIGKRWMNEEIPDLKAHILGQAHSSGCRSSSFIGLSVKLIHRAEGSRGRFQPSGS